MTFATVWFEKLPNHWLPGAKQKVGL